MTTETNVLPCPFCGAGPIQFNRVFRPHGAEGEMTCLNCKAVGPPAGPTADAAIAKWNGRGMQVTITQSIGMDNAV